MFWEGVMSDLSAIKLNGTTYTLSDDYARDSMAKIEYGTLATKAYAVGDFLINNNHLYKVTSAIAIGVKFVVGTNIELVKLSDEVKLKAPLASPTFTGTPKVPTASTGTKTTQIASTAYVQNEIDIVNNNVQSTIDYVQNELGGVLTSLRGDLNSLDSEVDTISDDVDSLDSAVDILTRQGTTLRDDGIVVCNAVDGGDNVFFMIDNTLTEAYKAADAKATGDAISSLNEDITNSLDSVDTEIGELKENLSEYVISRFTGEFTTTNATNFLLRYPCNIKSGDTVTVFASYTGVNASSYDIRFYNTSSQMAVIKTSQPFDVEYTFVADDDFTEVSLYKALSAAEAGNILSASVSIDGKLIKNVSVLNTQVTSLESDVSELQNNVKSLALDRPNLYDNITLVLGRVFKGVYNDNITNCHCTDFIPLVPGHTYAIYGGFLSSADYTNYYDDLKVYKGALPISKLNSSGNYTQAYNCAVFTAPSDCYYTRITFLNNSLDDNTTLKPSFYFRDITENNLAQKNVLVVGDSISTDVYGNYKKWPTILIEDGTFSRGFITNNSQHATGFVATYIDREETRFLSRVTALGDLSGYDMIITFGGINDWIQNVGFNDFKSAVVAYLIENATQARIIVLSPLHTALYGTTNSAGKTQKDYDDYIKSVANEYSFPCLNLTDESGFCPDKSATFSDMWTLLPEGASTHDGVHPNADWEKKYLAPQIEQFLKRLVS